MDWWVGIRVQFILLFASKCSFTSTDTLEYLVVLVHTGFEMNKMMGSAVQLTCHICDIIDILYLIFVKAPSETWVVLQVWTVELPFCNSFYNYLLNQLLHENSAFWHWNVFSSSQKRCVGELILYIHSSKNQSVYAVWRFELQEWADFFSPTHWRG